MKRKRENSNKPVVACGKLGQVLTIILINYYIFSHFIYTNITTVTDRHDLNV